MPTQTLWFFNETISTPSTQANVGPFTVTVNGYILKAKVNAAISFSSDNHSVPFVSVDDMMWGLQWVSSGAGPLNILTSATDNHWLWRHALGQKSDHNRFAGPQSTTLTDQAQYAMDDQYRGQGIRPSGAIDVYLSSVSIFGITSIAYNALGSIEFYFT